MMMMMMKMNLKLKKMMVMIIKMMIMMMMMMRMIIMLMMTIMMVMMMMRTWARWGRWMWRGGGRRRRGLRRRRCRPRTDALAAASQIISAKWIKRVTFFFLTNLADLPFLQTKVLRSTYVPNISTKSTQTAAVCNATLIRKITHGLSMENRKYNLHCKQSCCLYRFRGSQGKHSKEQLLSIGI